MEGEVRKDSCERLYKYSARYQHTVTSVDEAVSYCSRLDFQTSTDSAIFRTYRFRHRTTHTHTHTINLLLSQDVSCDLE